MHAHHHRSYKTSLQQDYHLGQTRPTRLTQYPHIAHVFYQLTKRLMLTFRCFVVQLDLERKLRALLTKEKERAEEQAALAMGLCTGGAILP